MSPAGGTGAPPASPSAGAAAAPAAGALPGGLLAVGIPAAAKLRLPLSRDQWVLLLAAANEAFLGLDTYLAHSMGGTIRPLEWIPIAFGPPAGAALLVAGLLAWRWRALATAVAVTAFLGSLLVGWWGTWLHGMQAILPDAPPGQAVTMALLVWAPPLFGPLAFAGVAVLGLSAVWAERAADSGRMWLPGGRTLGMPVSKTRAYLLLVVLGILAALISSVLDHARSGFQDPFLWLALAVGVFATAVSLALGAWARPRRGDVLAHMAAMLGLIVLGLLGTALHVHANLVGDAVFVAERFIRGAPVMAPLLFCNMGLLGLIVLLPPGGRA